MRRILSICLLSLVAVMSAQSAMAWGSFGHYTIAYIAEQHLTPEAKDKCRYYLKHTLPYYAMWMDHWRGVKEYHKINSGHAINVHSDGRTIKWEGFEPAGRAMGHLKNALEELDNGKYKNLPDSVVRQRLINMIHYIPDMHCPSHVDFPKSMYYTTQSEYTVYKRGKKANYHGFWDGSNGYRRRKWTVKKYAEEVDKVSPSQAKKWQKGSLEDWGRDIIKQAHRVYEITPRGVDLAELTVEQQDAVNTLADEMALRGAYRLAHVLNKIFRK